jgi:aryl-alcohol dehydrogenase-like predicted oxidoreductase
VRYTLLGRSGVRISRLALGTMTFGEEWKLSPSARATLLDRYAEAGGNVIDTADEYGDGSAETALGGLLAGRRDDFVLTTKYTMQRRKGSPNTAGNHRKNLVRALEGSLRRLGTDHLDVLWVHARDTLTPVAEVMRALDDQVRAGKLLYVGVSDWPAWEVAQANTLAELRDWSPFVGLQIRYNLLERTVERELLPMAHAFDLPVFAWGPLADGRLSGKYLRAEGGRLDHVAWGQGGRGPGDEVVEETVRIATETGRSPAQVALAWLLQRPANVVPILGATKEEQLADNLGALDLRLEAEALARLDEVSRVEPGFPHDFLRFPAMREAIYGDGWQDVDDLRSTWRRVPADDRYAAPSG